jgi:hypothetical protein
VNALAEAAGLELPLSVSASLSSGGPEHKTELCWTVSTAKALGAWLQVNGEAIYATHPWKRAAGETAEGIPVRFTQKESATYAILLGQPKASTATFKSLSVKPGTKIFLLGNADPLLWSQQGDNLPSICRRRSHRSLRVLVPHRWPRLLIARRSERDARDPGGSRAAL